MKIKTLIGALAMSLAAHSASAIGFTDTFDGPTVDPAWGTDRYSPNTVVANGVLELGISDADSAANRPPGYSGIFYNTQGLQRSVSITGPWEVSGQIEVITGDTIRRGDIWARTGLVGDETDSSYPIFGYRNFNPLDPFNASPAGISSAWRIWDPEAGGWVELTTTVVDGWHDLSFYYDGTSLNYSLNGDLVYTDGTPGLLADNLTTVFAQAYNLGGGDYVQRFDNISAQSRSTNSVPDGGATFALLGLGLAGLGLARRKK